MMLGVQLMMLEAHLTVCRIFSGGAYCIAYKTDHRHHTRLMTTSVSRTMTVYQRIP